jgi:para-nitrobenzyl esterase
MHKGRFGWQVALAAIALVSVAAAQVVTTQAGKVSGIATGDGAVNIFKGIPFAAPPVGPLRWKAPQPAAAWTDVLKADHFGHSCMQGPNTPFGPWTAEYIYVTPASEDCLYLNVWMPKAAAGTKLPVLVYIYGGGFNSGSGDCPIYDGEALARTGMVVVTFNYRVGALGFMAHPELTAESEHHSSGNYGLLDQIAALNWVKENIAGFGGDPSKIAIAGQSAGAMSVEDLLASPLAKGLFHAAIADSGIGGRGVPVRSLADAEKSGVEFAKSKNAASLAELRAVPAEKLVGGQFGPIVDGWVVSDQPMILTTTAGRDADVPVITGFQADDFRMAGGGPPMTAERFQQRARQTYGSMADEFLKLYPAATDDQAKQMETASARDRARAGMYLWASKRAATHKSPVYIYYFDRAIPWPAHPEFGAFHSGELPYTFGNLKVLDRPWEAADFKLAHEMTAYWKSMAANGDPNSATAPRWAAVNAAKPEVMRIGAEPGPMAPADAARLDFWKRYFESEQSRNAPIF